LATLPELGPRKPAQSSAERKEVVVVKIATDRNILNVVVMINSLFWVHSLSWAIKKREFSSRSSWLFFGQDGSSELIADSQLELPTLSPAVFLFVLSDLDEDDILARLESPFADVLVDIGVGVINVVGK
jgi:hypothetical protein